MLKSDELSNPNSCLSRAKDDERIFVLLARDVAAPAAIRAWIAERIRLGKNKPGDPQLVEAAECADLMQYGRVLGTPISQLSGRPGTKGYEEFKRIAESWGYP